MSASWNVSAPGGPRAHRLLAQRLNGIPDVAASIRASPMAAPGIHGFCRQDRNDERWNGATLASDLDVEAVERLPRVRAR
jgi:hypothetical protein